jgi:hypothetical protein
MLPEVIQFKGTYHGAFGDAVVKPVPDILDAPTPPVGTRWVLTKASLTFHCPVACARPQHTLWFNRAIPAPGIPNPNFDILARLRIPPGCTGDFVAISSYTAPSSPTYSVCGNTVVHLNAPIHLVTGAQVIEGVLTRVGIQSTLGSDLKTGNRVDYELDFALDTPGTCFVAFQPSTKLSGPTRTYSVGPVPSDKQWYAEAAALSLSLGTGTGAREASVRMMTATLATLAGADFSDRAPGSRVPGCGGYSTSQSGTANRGTATIWTSPLVYSSGDTGMGTLGGPAGDRGRFWLMFSQLPA